MNAFVRGENEMSELEQIARECHNIQITARTNALETCKKEKL